MAQDLNAANPEIGIGELCQPKISIDRMEGQIYLFFGKTPRAQLSVELSNPMSNYIPELVVLQERFPHAKISYQ